MSVILIYLRPSGKIQEASSNEGASGAATPVSELPGSGILGFLGQYRRGSGYGTQSRPAPTSYWSTSASLAVPGRWLSRQASMSSIDAPSPVVKSSSSGEIADQISAPLRAPVTFGLRAVILIAVIAFLVGSLMRSLLSPADFILINGHIGRGVPEWQEIKRLMHVHAFSFGFVVGIVQRVPV